MCVAYWLIWLVLSVGEVGPKSKEGECGGGRKREENAAWGLEVAAGEYCGKRNSHQRLGTEESDRSLRSLSSSSLEDPLAKHSAVSSSSSLPTSNANGSSISPLANGSSSTSVSDRTPIPHSGSASPTSVDAGSYDGDCFRRIPWSAVESTRRGSRRSGEAEVARSGEEGIARSSDECGRRTRAGGERWRVRRVEG